MMKRKRASKSLKSEAVASTSTRCLFFIFFLPLLSSISALCTWFLLNWTQTPHAVVTVSLPENNCFDRSFEFGPSSTEPGERNEFAKLFFSWPKSGRSVHKWVQYFDVYNRHLKHLKGKKHLRILEIGSGDGGSLQLWKQYFVGVDLVELYGVDIKNESLQFANEYTRMIIGDQGDEEFVKKRLPEALPTNFDMILDDGSHFSSHQIASFRFLFDLVLTGGIYLCEDTATSYWPGGGFGGGIESESSFISALVKRLIDVVHANNVRFEVWQRYVDKYLVPLSFVLRPPGAPKPSQSELEKERVWWSKLRSKIDNVHVYDQIVVIEARNNTGGFAMRMPENQETEIKHFFW